MALNDKQKKKMEAFLRDTPNRIRNHKIGRHSHLTDDVLGKIETIIGTGILQKYVYTQLDIPEQTWEGWKKRGREVLERLQDEDKNIEWEDLEPHDQKCCYLLSIIRSSKAKTITNTWQNMKKLGETNFKANEFILRTLGGNDFMHADHYVHHGIGTGGEEDETIREELEGFMPKTIEDLEGGEK